MENKKSERKETFCVTENVQKKKLWCFYNGNKMSTL